MPTLAYPDHGSTDPYTVLASLNGVAVQSCNFQTLNVVKDQSPRPCRLWLLVIALLPSLG